MKYIMAATLAQAKIAAQILEIPTGGWKHLNKIQEVRELSDVEIFMCTPTIGGTVSYWPAFDEIMLRHNLKNITVTWIET